VRLKPTTNQIPEVFPASRDEQIKPNVEKELQSVSPVTNPSNAVEPTSGKKMKLEDLYMQFLADEQVRIDKVCSQRMILILHMLNLKSVLL
jgi:hypothetical protein